MSTVETSGPHVVNDASDYYDVETYVKTKTDEWKFTLTLQVMEGDITEQITYAENHDASFEDTTKAPPQEVCEAYLAVKPKALYLIGMKGSEMIKEHEEVKRQLGHGLAKAAPKRNRFKDALLSQTACNPGAVCRSIADYALGMDTDEARNDPALRMMAYQLAYLFNTNGLDQGTTYVDASRECERRSDE